MSFEVTKKCPHCDTALEFAADGQRMVFTAHDDRFCVLETRARVRVLEHALLSQREAYERSFERYKRQVNELLAQHQLPSLDDRIKQHEATARLVWAQNEKPL